MFSGDNMRLFCKGDLKMTLENHYMKILQAVESIPEDTFLISSDDDIIQFIEPIFYIEPLQIYPDKKEMDTQETQVDINGFPNRSRTPAYVTGVQVTISFPYTGNPILWDVSIYPFMDTYTYAIIKSPNNDGVGTVEIVIKIPLDESPERVTNLLNEIIKEINYVLAQQSQILDSENASLPRRILDATTNRRNKLNQHQNIIKALNIPLKKRPDAPEISQLPIKRKLVRPLPEVSKEGYRQEVGISDADYEFILSVIRHEGRTFETTPKTYAVHDEEELRNIILAHLNGHFQGDATGETFLKKGKTDIRIENSDRAAFVAECKIWKGSKEIQTSCDQLLGYLTWRDCKAALIVFNKLNAKFSDILLKVPDAVGIHSLCLNKGEERQPGEWRYIFRTEEDDGRRILLHVFLFNLYSGNNKE